MIEATSVGVIGVQDNRSAEREHLRQTFAFSYFWNL